MGDPRSSIEISTPQVMSYWLDTWEKNNIGWHYSFVHPRLLKYIGMMTGHEHTAEPERDPVRFQQNSEKTWFIPLCGKTVDISYLLSQGYRVFGVDGAKKALEELNEEQNLGMTFDEKESLFTGMDGRIRIYCGDFFTAPMEKYGPFDYVFDRAAFCALEYHLREKYMQSMMRALKKPDGTWHDFKYLFEAFVYDKSRFGGPPRACDDADMKKYFQTWATVKFLSRETVPIQDHPQFRAVPDLGQYNRYYLMTPQ